MARDTLIKIRRGSTVPQSVDFDVGEPAFDGTNLYIKNSIGDMVLIGNKVTPSFENGRAKIYIGDGGTWIDPGSKGINSDNISGRSTSPTFGTGVNPTTAINGLDSSFIVPAGTQIRNLQFGGVYSSSNLDNIQLSVSLFPPSTVTAIQILNAAWDNGSLENSTDELNVRTIAINHTAQYDSLVSLYVKPTVTLAEPDEYFNAFWSFELIGPEYSLGTNYEFTEYDYTVAYSYYGGDSGSAGWKINRYSNSSSVKTVATNGNNGAYTTLATAWANRLTLTYG